MSAPTFHTGASKSTTKREMSERFPGAFYYTVERNDWHCRYVSSAPGFASAEAWVARILPDKDKETPMSWCVITPVDEAYLFVWAFKGVVQKAMVCSPAQFDHITLQRCDQIFITDESIVEYLPTNSAYQQVLPLSAEELTPFALKKHQSLVPFIGAAVFATVVGIGAWLAYPNTPPPAPAPIVMEALIDPFDDYRTALSSSVAASKTLQVAVALGAYGVLLPEHWPLKEISFNQHQLTLRAERSTQGQHAVIKAWLAANPALSEEGVALSLSDDALVLSVSHFTALTQWQGSIATTTTISQSIRDVLIASGWIMETDSEGTSDKYTTSMSFSQSDIVLSELQSLASMVETLPVGLASLSMIPTEVGRYSIEISLLVFGHRS